MKNMINRKRFQELVDKYLDKTITADENTELEKYYSTYGKQLFNNGDEHKTKRQLYLRIMTGVKNTKQVEVQKKQHKSVVLKIAASISIIIALGVSSYLFIPKEQVELITVSTNYGERRKITLPDSSSVTLNAGSSITYPETFTGDKRAVQMTGELFFDVKHDPSHPFTVSTGNLKTNVLGTSFNIKAYEDNPNIKISLATGSIKISKADITMATLQPDEQLLYTKATGKYLIETQSTGNDISWLENIIKLNDDSLEETIKIVERWFNVKLKVEIGNENNPIKTITGKFIDPTLEETIQSLELLSGSNITYENHVEP